MKRSLLLTVILMFFASLLLVGCGSNQGSEPTSSEEGKEDKVNDNDKKDVLTLQLGHTLIPDSERQISAEKFAELVSEKSDGSIKVEIFPQSQLGGEVKMNQALRTGSLALSITSQNTLENVVKEFSILDLPFLFDSPQQVMQVLNGEAGQTLFDMLPEYDLVGLGWMWPNERNLFGNKAIRTAEDLEGMKLRVMQAPGYLKTYETLKAQPTPMAYSEVYLGIEQGVVDGAATSPDQFIMDKFVEVAQYYNKTQIHFLPMVLTMSKPIWDKMTEEQQSIITESAKEMIAFNMDFNETYQDQFYEEMEAAGTEIIEPDLDSLKKASEPVYESIISEIPNGQELFDLIQEAKK